MTTHGSRPVHVATKREVERVSRGVWKRKPFQNNLYWANQGGIEGRGCWLGSKESTNGSWACTGIVFDEKYEYDWRLACFWIEELFNHD